MVETMCSIVSWSFGETLGVKHDLKNCVWWKILKTTSVRFLVYTLKEANTVTLSKNSIMVSWRKAGLSKNEKMCRLTHVYTEHSCLWWTIPVLLKLKHDKFVELVRAVTYNKNLDIRATLFKDTKWTRKWVPVVRNRNKKSSRTSDLSPLFLVEKTWY